MLLRNRNMKPTTMIGIGQLCLVFGLLGQYVVFPPSAFWQGFVYGLSTVAIGVSIVFNVRGMVLHRRQQ